MICFKLSARIIATDDAILSERLLFFIGIFNRFLINLWILSGTPQNIFMVMIGCFFGTIIGMLPGLGPMTAIALMIPITYGFDPATGLILMAGVYYGAVFGGST